MLSVALQMDDGQVGTLTLSSRTSGAFDDEALDIAREVGSELAIAIAQMRLRQALADRAEELGRLAEERQQMLHRIVRAQEEERERVALELHDGLGQILTSISLFASDLAEEVGEEARPRAQRVNELIRRAIVDSRQLVWSLRPPELERLGLVPALRRLADETSATDLTVDLHEQIGDVRLPPESEAVVYRVVQEAVHNAQKHAGASAISILLQRSNGRLTTLVEDNGCGFDPAAIPPGRGLGLIGMRERAELVEGALVVESAVHSGTRVRLVVPVGVPLAGSNGGDGT
jgi:two-component system sensor histidine kinase DegS